MDNSTSRQPLQGPNDLEPLAEQNGVTNETGCRVVIIFPTRFELGALRITPGAACALEEAGQLPTAFLIRHATGDWGVVDANDWQENEFALANGLRLLSAYDFPDIGECIWIITEADRSATTILLPEEY